MSAQIHIDLPTRRIRLEDFERMNSWTELRLLRKSSLSTTDLRQYDAYAT